MDSILEYIDKYDIKIPEYVDYSHRSNYIALEDGNINLLKSLIAYKNHLKKRDEDLNTLEISLDKD
jgi:hypothetical protein